MVWGLSTSFIDDADVVYGWPDRIYHEPTTDEVLAIIRDCTGDDAAEAFNEWLSNEHDERIREVPPERYDPQSSARGEYDHDDLGENWSNYDARDVYEYARTDGYSYADHYRSGDYGYKGEYDAWLETHDREILDESKNSAHTVDYWLDAAIAASLNGLIAHNDNVQKFDAKMRQSEKGYPDPYHKKGDIGFVKESFNYIGMMRGVPESEKNEARNNIIHLIHGADGEYSSSAWLHIGKNIKSIVDKLEKRSHTNIEARRKTEPPYRHTPVIPMEGVDDPDVINAASIITAYWENRNRKEHDNALNAVIGHETNPSAAVTMIRELPFLVPEEREHYTAMIMAESDDARHAPRTSNSTRLS